MIRAGRPADPDFSPDELLFYRLEGNFDAGVAPRGLQVHSPEFSVNREKHGGLAEYVLIPDWTECGIAQFNVASVPGPKVSLGGVQFSWSVSHEPEDNNFHHSGVATLKAGVRCRKSSQINDLVKKEFKQELAEKMKVIKGCSIDDF